MTQPGIIIIADDLTGAADAAAGLIRYGLVTLIAVEPTSVPPCDALVISTESRHQSQDEAVARVESAFRVVHDASAAGPPPLYYKKIDSTLRGHPGAELATLFKLLQQRRTLVAPAFPAQGRTTMDGIQLLDGIPVNELHFGDEVPTADISALLIEARCRRFPLPLPQIREGATEVATMIASKGADLFIADAETEEDLLTLAIAAVAADLKLLCGSAGLMAALARTVPWEPAAPAPDLPPPPAGPTLTVAASRQPRTAEQVAYAETQGALVVRPDLRFFEDEAVSADSQIYEACLGLQENRPVILTTCGLDAAPCGREKVAARLADWAHEILARQTAGRIVLTGGDMAAAVAKRLAIMAIWLQGEVEPGIPRGRILGGPHAGLPITTKAGGFGSEGALWH